MANESIGKRMQQESKQFRITYDADLGVWRILNAWHPSLEALTFDAEIPDDSPAVVVIPQGAFTALLEEADRRGILAKFIPLLVQRQQAEMPVVELKETEPPKPLFSEQHDIKARAIEALLRLATLGEVSEVK